MRSIRCLVGPVTSSTEIWYATTVMHTSHGCRHNAKNLKFSDKPLCRNVQATVWPCGRCAAVQWFVSTSRCHSWCGRNPCSRRCRSATDAAERWCVLYVSTAFVRVAKALKKLKLTTGQLFCIALCRDSSPPKRSEWHLVTRDHAILPTTHTFIRYVAWWLVPATADSDKRGRPSVSSLRRQPLLLVPLTTPSCGRGDDCGCCSPWSTNGVAAVWQHPPPVTERFYRDQMLC